MHGSDAGRLVRTSKQNGGGTQAGRCGGRVFAMSAACSMSPSPRPPGP